MAVAASEPIVLLSDSNMLQVSTNACWECFQWLSSISRIDVILALYFYLIFFIFGHNEQNFNGDRIMVENNISETTLFSRLIQVIIENLFQKLSNHIHIYEN